MEQGTRNKRLQSRSDSRVTSGPELGRTGVWQKERRLWPPPWGEKQVRRSGGARHGRGSPTVAALACDILIVGTPGHSSRAAALLGTWGPPELWHACPAASFAPLCGKFGVCCPGEPRGSRPCSGLSLGPWCFWAAVNRGSCVRVAQAFRWGGGPVLLLPPRGLRSLAWLGFPARTEPLGALLFRGLVPAAVKRAHSKQHGI